MFNKYRSQVPSDWVVTDCDQGVLAMQCPEEYVNVGLKDITVWVDPLDGTSEYAQVLILQIKLSWNYDLIRLLGFIRSCNGTGWFSN